MKITELTLFTSNLKEQIRFYTDILEFSCIEQTKNSASFKTGNSILHFKEKQHSKPYHFAFNIPNNKIEQAYKWLQKRVEFITDNNNEIIHFEKWNANALYFYDIDNNIVEFIARNTLNITSNREFSSNEVISICEIGIPTNNLKSIYQQINNIKKIDMYDGNLKRFCALGNEEGLFIIINKETKKWFPPMDEAYTEDFIIKGDYNFEYINEKITSI